MPDTPRQRDPQHGTAAERSAKTAVLDSFPASDPVAATNVVGTRAVNPATLMKRDVEIRGATTVVAHLADQETAKLTVEYLVRKLPLDRRRATLRNDEDGTVVLEVAAAEEADAARIAEMLRRYDREDDD